MKKTRASTFTFALSFIDMLFNILLCVFSLFILSMVMINDPKKLLDQQPPQKGELMITMTWDDQSAHDIDLWLLTPERQRIGYNSKEGTYATLERDDLGLDNDWTIVNGREVYLRLNKEVITIRIRRPGHYIVAVFFFERKVDSETKLMDMAPVSVKTELDQLRPFKALFANTVILDKSFSEKTAFSFDIDADGNVNNFSTEPEMFVGRSGAGEHYGSRNSPDAGENF